MRKNHSGTSHRRRGAPFSISVATGEAQALSVQIQTVTATAMAASAASASPKTSSARRSERVSPERVALALEVIRCAVRSRVRGEGS